MNEHMRFGRRRPRFWLRGRPSHADRHPRVVDRGVRLVRGRNVLVGATAAVLLVGGLLVIGPPAGGARAVVAGGAWALMWLGTAAGLTTELALAVRACERQVRRERVAAALAADAEEEQSAVRTAEALLHSVWISHHSRLD